MNGGTITHHWELKTTHQLRTSSITGTSVSRSQRIALGQQQPAEMWKLALFQSLQRVMNVCQHFVFSLLKSKVEDQLWPLGLLTHRTVKISTWCFRKVMCVVLFCFVFVVTKFVMSCYGSNRKKNITPQDGVLLYYITIPLLLSNYRKMCMLLKYSIFI